MASSKAIWGIDIGQCALKALRLRPHDEPGRVVADAFDFIEYPKILSQPEADPAELVSNALEQFLSRNSVKGDKVAVSVSGQAGLARFIKLPPVEARKIPDIVKYEAKQQIPFALTDVVWDYQRMPGGSETDGFVLEAEVGLFAMKREQVYRALQPYKDAGIEVDFVQLTPLALYNWVVFDQMKDLPPPEDYNPESPPESIVLLSLGTDTTDLVVTNGYRVWQRSIPLGGNHFTKALTKELKVTFAKAEHLKRNAMQAENAKAVFQAMRPVFGDLLTEIQRSIGYFSNIDRNAKISRVIALGNAMKLHGLQKFLQQSLGMDVVRPEAYRSLSGSAVVDSAAFKDNLLSFGVCYGLALQGLRDVSIKTNLIPHEIVKDRMIRAKKPWAVATAAILMLGFSTSFMGYYKAWVSVHDEKFAVPLGAAKGVIDTASAKKNAFDTAKTDYTATSMIGEHLVHNVEGRLLWLEMMKALNGALPTDPTGQPVEDITKRNQIYVTEINCLKVPDLATNWWLYTTKFYEPPGGLPAVAAVDPNAPPPTDPAAVVDPAAAAAPVDPAAAAAPVDPNAAVADPNAIVDPAAAVAAPAVAGSLNEYPTGPSGSGWVIQLVGYHFHNSLEDQTNSGPEFLQKTIIKNLHENIVPCTLLTGEKVDFTMRELGIGYPMLISPQPVMWENILPADDAMPGSGLGMGGMGGMAGMGMGGMGGMGGYDGGGEAMPGGGMPGAGMPGMGGGPGLGPDGLPLAKKVPRHNFIIQFCWIETPASKRMQNKEAAEKAAADAEAAKSAVPDTAAPDAAAPQAPATEAPATEAAANPAAAGTTPAEPADVAPTTGGTN